MPEISFPYLKQFSKYLVVTLFSSLVAGRFAYLSLLYAGEINEFASHFRYYALTYLLLFSFVFLAVSILYVFLLSVLGKIDSTRAASADLYVNLLFLVLLPYLIDFRYLIDSLGFSLLYFVVLSVILIRVFLLISAIWKNRSSQERIIYILLIGLFFLGIALRLRLLFTVGTVVDSDEAIWGLMARHILFKFEHPTVFYGQSYMGSLSAYIAALLFFLFGASSFTLKLVPLLFSIVFLISAYFLARQIFSSLVALVCFLLVAVGSPFIIFYSVTAWGYIEVLAIGNVILLISIILRGIPSGRNEFALYALLGFLMGLALWVNVFAVIYIFTVSVFFIWRERLALFSRKFLLLFSFFILGLLPLIIYNLHHEFATFKHLFLASGGSFVLEERLRWATAGVSALFLRVIPRLLGIRGSAVPALLIIYLIYVVSFLFGFILLALDRKKRQPTSLKEPQGLMMLQVLVFTNIFFFISSYFGAIYQVPRYMLVSYTSLSIFLSAFIVYSAQRSKLIASAFMIIILLSNLQGNAAYSRNRPLSVVRAMRFLEKNNGVSHIYTEYWIAYQLTFISKERIICTPQSGLWSNRYPSYTNQVDRAPYQTVGFIFPKASKNIKKIEDFLRKKGITYRKNTVQDYTVLNDLSGHVASSSIPLMNIEWDKRLVLGN